MFISPYIIGYFISAWLKEFSKQLALILSESLRIVWLEKLSLEIEKSPSFIEIFVSILVLNV